MSSITLLDLWAASEYIGSPFIMPGGVDLSCLVESAGGSFRNRKSLVHLTLSLQSCQESQLSLLDHSGVTVQVVVACLGSLLLLVQVSMVDGSLFDSLEAIARSLKGNNKPFGGIQLVLAGL